MNKMPSVTDVINILRKYGLEIWFKENTAEFCDAESKRGKEVGKIIHSIIQGSIEEKEVKFETEYPDEVTFCLKGLAKFKKEHPELKFKKAEMEVISSKHGYIGHLDCLGEENRELILCEWKSGKCDVGKVDKYGNSKEKDIPPIYPEHEYQTSAYVVAYNEQERAHVEKGIIVVFAKDKVAYNYMSLSKEYMDEAFSRVFLPALSICKYQMEKKADNGYGKRPRVASDTKTVVGRSNKSAKIPAGF